MTDTIPNKIFKPIIIINWKTGKTRVVQKKPRTLGPWEIPVMFELRINVPQNPEIFAKGEVDIPAYKLKEMFVKAI